MWGLAAICGGGVAGLLGLLGLGFWFFVACGGGITGNIGLGLEGGGVELLGLLALGWEEEEGEEEEEEEEEEPGLA